MTGKGRRTLKLLFHLCLVAIGLVLFAWGFQKFYLWNSYWSIGLTAPQLEDYWWRLCAFVGGALILIVEIALLNCSIEGRVYDWQE